MSTTALVAIAVGYLCAIALQCMLWFAAYKAGMLLAATLLALAAALLTGIGVYMMLSSSKKDTALAQRMQWFTATTGNPVVQPA